MAAKNPRVNAVLETPLYDALASLARRDRVSLSQKVRDLVRDALELEEDEALERVVERRRASSRRRRWLGHADVKRRLGLK
jgi:hypothetical protein